MNKYRFKNNLYNISFILIYLNEKYNRLIPVVAHNMD